ncbi:MULTISPECIES: HpcH/HpaI aldolase/citrate lyase family protein [unclassified Gordonia (in: high G+C Gram-positive bacteria)]
MAADEPGPDDLDTARTFLFVPGNRPERFAKAEAAGADVVVIDLEDAVAPTDKVSTRDHVAGWLAAGHSAVIRVNAATTEWHRDDVALAARFGAATLVAKAESAESLADIAAATAAPVIPLVETAVGLTRCADLAQVSGVARIAFGAIDFAAELRVDPDDREALLFARSSLVVASAAARIGSPVDGVTTALRDPGRLTDDVRYAARIGLQGKLCIHPAQVEVVHECLAPSSEEVAWAERIVDAVARSDGSAIAVDGQMVDPPVVARAERILAAAQR